MFSKLLAPLYLLASFNLLKSQDLPYPPSKVIKAVSWDTSSMVQFGPGSDQWPMTWADDGHIYAGWGDGWGWTQRDEKKRSLGITRIVGLPPNLEGEDIYGVGPGQSFGKPDALIAYDQRLHLFWTNGDSKYENDTYTAVSVNGGQTWSLGNERLFYFAPAGFRVRGVLQYGQGYAGAKDDHIYVYCGINRHPDIYLARVHKDQLFNAVAYQWFVYVDVKGKPFWTQDFSRKAAVFHDNNAYLWHVSVCYHEGIDQYLLTKPHFGRGDNRTAVRAPHTHISNFGMFAGATPWGPWTTVVYEEDFLDEHVKFNYIIPTKFISAQENEFWLAWSGWPEYDNVSFMKGKFLFW